MRRERFLILLVLSIGLPLLVLLFTNLVVTTFAGSQPSVQPLPGVLRAHFRSENALRVMETQTCTTYLPFVAKDWPGCVTWDFRGVAMDGYWHTAFASPMAYDFVDYFDAIGANYVALVVTWYQPTIISTGPITVTQRTVDDEDLARIIEYIHSKGMEVMLKPHVDPEAGWRGTFGPAPGDDPEAWYEAWFANFTNFIVHYADLAERYGVEVLCIGTEFVSLTNPATGNTGRWLHVIDVVKSRYRGKLTYAAHMDHEYRLIPKEVWQKLDYAGVNIYYTLSTEVTPQVDDLINAWHFYDDPRSVCVIGPGPWTYYDNLKNWQATIGIPVIFPEIGYRSIDYAATAPYRTEGPSHRCVSDSVRYNSQGQANCYETVFRVFNNLDWMEGAFWWRFEPVQGAPGIGVCPGNDYSPACKPAGDILASWYCGSQPPELCRPVPRPAPPIVDLFEYVADKDAQRAWQVESTGIVTLTMDLTRVAPGGISTKSMQIDSHIPYATERYMQIKNPLCSPQDWTDYRYLEIWVKADDSSNAPDGGEFSVVLVDGASPEGDEVWQSTRWINKTDGWVRATIGLSGQGTGDPWLHPADFVVPPWEVVRNGVLDLGAIKSIWLKALTGLDYSLDHPDFRVWVDNTTLLTTTPPCTPTLPIVDAFEYPANVDAWRIWTAKGTGQVTLTTDVDYHAPITNTARSLRIDTQVQCANPRYEQLEYNFCQPEDWSQYNLLSIWVRGDGPPPGCPSGGEFSIFLVDGGSAEPEIWQSTKWLSRDRKWRRMDILLSGRGEGDPFKHDANFVIPEWVTPTNGQLDTNAIRGVGIKSLTGQDVCDACPGFTVWVDQMELSRVDFAYDFEGSTQGWGMRPEGGVIHPGEGVTATSLVTQTGSYSMRFEGLGATGTDDVAVQRNLYGANKIIAYIYVPPGAPYNLYAQFFIFDYYWNWHDNGTGGVSLRPGEWVALSWDLYDKTWPRPWREVGIHFSHLSDYPGQVYIDSIVLITHPVSAK